MQLLPADHKVVVSRAVDTRSLGTDVSFSDDHFTKSTLYILAAPVHWKLTTLAYITTMYQLHCIAT